MNAIWWSSNGFSPELPRVGKVLNAFETQGALPLGFLRSFAQKNTYGAFLCYIRYAKPFLLRKKRVWCTGFHQNICPTPIWCGKYSGGDTGTQTLDLCHAMAAL